MGAIDRQSLAAANDVSGLRRKFRRSSAAVATNREGHHQQICDYSPHCSRWLSLLPSCSGIARREGKMTDWVPVLIMALVVVCVTAYLLSDPKLRLPRKDR
jgi:hypothetical protein